MVLGLAPVFIFWKLDMPKISFHLAVWFGIISGLVLTFGLLPKSLFLTTGKYADLLAINIYGTIIIFILFFIPYFFMKRRT